LQVVAIHASDGGVYLVLLGHEFELEESRLLDEILRTLKFFTPGNCSMMRFLPVGALENGLRHTELVDAVGMI
jgi:hypothetical protein